MSLEKARAWGSRITWFTARLAAIGWLSWLLLHAALLFKGGILRVVAWYFFIQIVPVSAIPPLLGSIVALLWWRRSSPLIGLFLASSLLALLPGAIGFGLIPMTYPLTSLESATPAAIVRCPTDREMQVVWGGDDIDVNYHAADPAQRWAYDLVVAPVLTGSSDLSSYGCYGIDVLAPASGRVSLAVDGHPDGDPTRYVPNYLAPAGNHVAIELEMGTFLVVAHLQRGSLAVAQGDRVIEGQKLGRCGNSGNSSEPHVHIHHQRQDPSKSGLIAEGLPLYFRDLIGREGAAMPVGGIEVDGESVRLLGESIAARP